MTSETQAQQHTPGPWRSIRSTVKCDCGNDARAQRRNYNDSIETCMGGRGQRSPNRRRSVDARNARSCLRAVPD